MPSTTDLIGLALEKNPVDFADMFNDIIGQRALDALEAKKIELAQSIYGSPEDAEPEDDSAEDDSDLDDDFDFDDDEDLDDDSDLDDDDFDFDDEDDTDDSGDDTDEDD